MPAEKCPFCEPDIFKYPHYKRFGEEKFIGVKVLDTSNFFVEPDIFPGHPKGFHFLIVPKPHVLSTVELGTELDGEFSWIVRRIEEQFGEVLLAEHGNTKEGVARGNKIQTINHGHVHAYPREGFNLLAAIRSRLERYGIPYGTHGDGVDPFTATTRGEFREHPYLLARQGNEILVVHEAEGLKMPSQLIQLSVSAALNEGHETDWKRIPGVLKKPEDLAKLPPISGHDREAIARTANLLQTLHDCKL